MVNIVTLLLFLQGPQGSDGVAGPTGAQGQQGPPGQIGFPGLKGATVIDVQLCTNWQRTLYSTSKILIQGFLTGGTCTPWGTKHQSRGCEMRRRNIGYFKLFAKNLFSIFEIRKHFPKPFLTSAFLNDFLS